MFVIQLLASSMETYDFLFKIVLIGESGVGKSSLVARYMDGSFVDTHLSTIGVDFSIRTVDIEDKRVKLQVWDTAGQERFRGLCRQFYRSAKAVLFVYDVTEPSSFQQLSQWLQGVKQYGAECVKLVLIGNKTDLMSERIVQTSEGREFAKNHGMTFFETSARDGEGVGTVFEDVALQLTKEAKAIELKSPVILSKPGPGRKVEREPCCRIS